MATAVEAIEAIRGIRCGKKAIDAYRRCKKYHGKGCIKKGMRTAVDCLTS